MAHKKKKRTVLLSEDPSKVTPESFKSKTAKAYSAVHKYVKIKNLGVGGTIGSIKRQGKPPVKIKYRAGLSKGGQKGVPGRLRGKARLGFRFKVEF